MKHHAGHGKGYAHSEARGGHDHGSPHAKAHESAIKHLDAHDHLTKKGGSHPEVLPGDLTPHEHSKASHSEMGAVKKVAGGSNY